MPAPRGTARLRAVASRARRPRPDDAGRRARSGGPPAGPGPTPDPPAPPSAPAPPNPPPHPLPDPAPTRPADTDSDSAPSPEPQDENAALPPGWLELLGAVGSLLSLLTAVLFYFGWSSTDAETRALGLRDTVLRLSTIDYLLRSVDALFLPAWLVAAAALAGTGLHHWVKQSPGRAETVTRVFRHAWLPPLALLALLPGYPAAFELIVPLAMILGFLLTTYSRTLPGPGTLPTDRRRALRLWGLTVLISVLLLFWATSAYAGIVGRSRAAEAARTVNTAFPAVVVFSEKDLLIRGNGTCYNRITDKDSAYGFRYAGLRLFHVSGDRVFLVGSDWTPGSGTLWVIEKDDTTRVEFSNALGRPRPQEC
ncbi:MULTISPECIES: hypothetical protein [unclassified Streptomyces]|uniref:hypothetical protein n=1 Tax=unclassified Streptomyces TaxID=2593676 RepID=UPI00131A5BE2|nr:MULTISPECIES: hypothetical protein [unclassified Streptomyces]